jgi:hydrogenase/urease accessory protein HupE
MSSYSIARLKPDGIELQIKIAADSAWPVVQDTVAPGAIFVREEFETVGRPQLLAFAKTLDRLAVDGAALTPRKINVAVVDDNFIFTLLYPRPMRGTLRLQETYLKHMSFGYVSHITFLDENEKQLASKILEVRDETFEMVLPLGGNESAPPPQSPPFRAFFLLGIEHILTGYDHLLFLCGLLVVCRRVSTMLGIITCFTLAHSLTLGLAALNVISLPGRIVEPLIAATIVYVGIENLLRHEEPKGRWALTFLFGLVHGFGFASVLREMGLGSGGASILKPLFSFNLGVELGQIAVTLALLPALWLVRRSVTGARVLTPALSILVVLLGSYWLLQRTVLT